MQPATLGRYRITGVLGRGGMGVVYAAHDPQIDRPVAIKTIALDRLDAQARSSFEARFVAEMRSSGRLQHPNIAALYDAGRDGDVAYIVMELVAGRDLRQRLADGERFGVARALDIARQLLAALDDAHRRHVVHRDVKPANVMLQDDGVVKLCDFGVARLADPDATLTQGMVVGSLRYASPEQLAGQPVDARSDVFSAAVTLHELLTGEPPFAGRTDAEALLRVATQEAPSARARRAEVPPDVDAALRRALDKDPDARFAGAAEFAHALGVAPSSSDGSTGIAAAAASPPPSPPSPPSPPTSTAPGRTAVAAGAAVAVAALAAGAWYASRPAAGVDVRSRLAAAASSSRASSRPAATVAAAAASAAVVGVPQGAWRGTWACGPILGRLGPGTEAFSASLAIDVSGRRLSWSRSTVTVRTTMVGRFDPDARFRAEGVGSRTDRKESWLEWVEGRYDPATRRLDGRGQLVRPGDGSVARECTLTAVRGAAPAASESARTASGG